MTEISKNLSDNTLFEKVSFLIEKSKNEIIIQNNSVLTQLFWKVGQLINTNILENSRAHYGKQIVVSLSQQLVNQYGRNFEEKNLRRMLQFAEQFNDFENVVSLSRQLSWSHILVILPIKSFESKLFYIQQTSTNALTVRELRKLVSSKTFERTAIANTQIYNQETIPKNIFKDPYLLDFLNLEKSYLENDLESAILRDLETFILELGKGFAFVERQKRIIIDDEDFYIDLLFYHRKIKRLIAIELKVGKFKAKYKGQMELYLKWLDKYEKQEDENTPIGLILCTETSKEQIELLEMSKDGIVVAEYWTDLLPKEHFETKIKSLVLEAKEKFEIKKLN